MILYHFSSPLEVYYRVFYTFLTCWSAPIIALYILMVVFSGQLMKLFNPLQLRVVLILHNFVCCVMSLLSMVGFIVGLWQTGDIYSMEHAGGILLHSMLVYWVSKLVELMDTVYMLLRHKQKQMSFLHVWHHSSMALLADYAYHHATWPAVIVIVALNSAVHVVMYGYYGLTAVYPLHAFTWKKRITQLQMAQFIIGIFFALYGYFHYGFCIYSILYGVVMLILFSNFYYHAFVRRQKSTKQMEGREKED